MPAKLDNTFVDVLTSAKGYAQLGHPTMGALLAFILLNASIIGACAVSLSTSYAFGDVFNVRHSLHRKVNEAKVFYGSYAGLVILAGAIVLIPNAPLVQEFTNILQCDSRREASRGPQ